MTTKLELTEPELLAIEKLVEDALDDNERDGGEFFSFLLLNALIYKVRLAISGHTVEIPVEPPSLEVTGNSIPMELPQ